MFHDIAVSSAHRLVNGLGAAAHGDLERSVSERFLHHLDIFPVRFQPGCSGVPEDVPGDMISELRGLEKVQCAIRRKPRCQMTHVAP